MLEFYLLLSKTMLCLVDTLVLDNLVWDLWFLTESRPGSRQSWLLICNIDTSWSMTFHFRSQSAILQPINSAQSCFLNECQLRFQVADLPIFYNARFSCALCILILISVPSIDIEDSDGQLHAPSYFELWSSVRSTPKLLICQTDLELGRL